MTRVCETLDSLSGDGLVAIGGADTLGPRRSCTPVHARGRLAVMPRRSNLDWSISIRRNLTFHAAYHGVPSAAARARAGELLKQFGLRERGAVKPDISRVARLSG